ncbi:MAG TPA: DUF1427 family protein [Roseiarcus sp.]|jgi:xanthosine utilization system XapX-like protein|nr:DUF1427 family protein [Roseiarcus sp.]
MIGYFVSLLMGLVVGVAYALVQVRSPAPAADRSGWLVGHGPAEKVVDMVKRHLPSKVGQPSADVQKPRPWSEGPHELMSA